MSEHVHHVQCDCDDDTPHTYTEAEVREIVAKWLARYTESYECDRLIVGIRSGKEPLE